MYSKLIYIVSIQIRGELSAGIKNLVHLYLLPKLKLKHELDVMEVDWKVEIIAEIGFGMVKSWES